MTDVSDMKTDDWEACAGFSASGGVLVGAMQFVIWMRSRKLNIGQNFTFFGVGITGGYLPAGMSWDDKVTNDDFTLLECDNPFSLNDLHYTTGRVATATIATPLCGYSLVAISAGFYPSLFNSQAISGWCDGIDGSADFMRGIWTRTGLTKPYALPRHSIGPKANKVPASLNKKSNAAAKRAR